jgi:hypothetical protein
MNSADRLQASYDQHAAPYELLIETIALQNKAITSLTSKLSELQTQ